jgi:hypothetical protein
MTLIKTIDARFQSGNSVPVGLKVVAKVRFNHKAYVPDGCGFLAMLPLGDLQPGEHDLVTLASAQAMADKKGSVHITAEEWAYLKSQIDGMQAELVKLSAIHNPQPIANNSPSGDAMRNQEDCNGCTTCGKEDHTIECCFSHFLAYMGYGNEPEEVIEKLRLAYSHGADAAEKHPDIFQSQLAAAVAAEREACAKLCESIKYKGYVPPEDGQADSYFNGASQECAYAIRSQGEQSEL